MKKTTTVLFQRKVKEGICSASELKSYLLNEPNLENVENLVQKLFEISSGSERDDFDLALLILSHVKSTQLSSFQFLLETKLSLKDYSWQCQVFTTAILKTQL